LQTLGHYLLYLSSL